jgi:hypothetical protein
MIKRRPIDEQGAGRELGIIRIGEKKATANGGSRPAMRETFRLTSPYRAILEAVKARYGGELRPWKERAGHWELLTDVNELKCVLIPDDCVNQWYERWSGGGCTHRCDGETVRMIGREGEPIERECLCDPDNRECALMTRLSVMLSDVPILGVWRLNSKGKIFAKEAWAEVERMRSLGFGRQAVFCLLQVRQQEIKRPGQGTKKFSIPGITLDPEPPNFVGFLRGCTVAGQLEAQGDTPRQIEAPAQRRIEAPATRKESLPVDMADEGVMDAEYTPQGQPPAGVIDLICCTNGCGQALTRNQATYSRQHFAGELLCSEHQRERKAAA